MANVDIARALKDQDYFNSLTEEEKALVRAADPSGEIDVNDDDLDTVSGGIGEDGAAATGTGSRSLSTGGGSSEEISPVSCHCHC